MYPHEDDISSGAFVKHQAEHLERLGHSVKVLRIHGYRSKLNYLKAV